MRISVVIPALNEEGNIGRLIAETIASIPSDNLGEIVVVDDCSDDRTGDEIATHFGGSTAVRYLRHGRRGGQSAALRTGVWAAAYPVIATMDGDGQNDPADIPVLLARLASPSEDGPALVGGIRVNRRDTGSKRIASRLANAIRAWMLADGCPDTGCGIKVYRRDAFVRLPYFSGMHRYLPALFLSYGHEVAYAPVNDRPRIAGRSKYSNLGRALLGIYDLLGVRWLRRRTILAPVVEDIHGEFARAGALDDGRTMRAG